MLQALQFTTELLNKHLMAHFSQDETKALLSSPVRPDGSLAPECENKVLLTLMSVDRNAVKAPISFGYKAAVAQPKEEVVTGNYTLYVLASANFNVYTEALDHLDTVISFFTANTTFDTVTHADLPAGIAKLEMALEGAEALQMRSIWLAMGARYQPSVVYKLTSTAK